MSFNDDDQIIAPSNSGPRPTPILPGRVQLVPYYNKDAPLEKNSQKVMLELTGGDSTVDRSGLDLVAVLDVSESMKGEKIERMKTAMKFVIKKLSPIDRLSIVSFRDAADKLCRLRQITETSQPELQGLINGLKAGGNTNISDGLRTGLKVLAGRKVSGGRVVGVMLMSDGEQNRGGDAAQVTIGDVPVYTFGFGKDHDPKLLQAVANKSTGGTFSVVRDGDSLSLPFSQCLAGLLTVVVQELKLTVAGVKDELTIKTVTAGSYPQTRNVGAGSLTVSLGDLYSREVRNIIVDLDLPGIKCEREADILEVKYSYRTSGKLFDARRVKLTVRRTGRSGTAKPPKVQTEETRLQTAAVIKEATKILDDKKLGDARAKLKKALEALEKSSTKQVMLVTELKQLLKLMETKDAHDKEGRPYALSSETSHARQRFAARGDIVVMRLFATLRMDVCLEQAKKFDKNPTMPVPSVDDDVNEEIAANPLARIAGPINYYIEDANQNLQDIKKLINGGEGIEVIKKPTANLADRTIEAINEIGKLINGAKEKSAVEESAAKEKAAKEKAARVAKETARVAKEMAPNIEIAIRGMGTIKKINVNIPIEGVQINIRMATKALQDMKMPSIGGQV